MYVTFTTTEEPMAVPEAVAYALDHPTERIANAKWDAELPRLTPSGPAWAYDDDPDLPPTLDTWVIKQCKGLIKIGYIAKPHLYATTELYAVSDGTVVSYLYKVPEGATRLKWGNGWSSEVDVPAGWYPVLSATFVPANVEA